MSDPPILDVIGGSGGIAAGHAAIRALAAQLDALGDRWRGWAAVCARMLVGPGALEAGLLAPLAATSLAEGLRCEANASGARAAVEGLEEADDLVRASFDALDYAVGRTLGMGLPVGVAGAAVSGLVTDHPSVVRHVLNGSGGFLDSLVLGPLPVVLHPSPESAAATAARVYADPGRAEVVHRPSVPALGPSDLTAAMETLRRVSDRPPGTIAVQSVGGGHIVYLPGTDDAGVPWELNPEVRDVQTDLLAAAGQPNAYLDGIRIALAEAGVGPDDPVLVVGHSLGGLLAGQLAQDPAYSVAAIVTAGSPVTVVPDGIAVLSLENRGDVVPLVLGDAPPDTVDRVTVRFDDHEDSVVGNHDPAHYVVGAAAVEASADPTLRDQLSRLEPWLTGAPGTLQEFTITRTVS